VKKVWLTLLSAGMLLLLFCLASAARPVLADPEQDDALGAILDLDASTGSQDSPDVAWNSSCNQFLVVYGGRSVYGNSNIWGRYVAGDGQTLQAGPFKITPNPQKQRNPAVAYIPGTSNFLVVWEDYRNDAWEIWGQVVDCDTNLVGAPVQMTTNSEILHYQLNPDVACGYGSDTSSGCWAVWEDLRNGNKEIWAQKLTTSGALSDDNVRLTKETHAQGNPTIAYNPDGTGCDGLGSFMVVWDDARNGNRDIYAQQLNWSALCGNNLPVYVDSPRWQRFPDVAYSTTSDEYQVIWTYSQTTYRLMVGPSGAVQGTPLLVGEGRYAQAAYDGNSDRFATVVPTGGVGGHHDIYRQRTTGSGALYGGSAPVVAKGEDGEVAIAFGATSDRYFVVWRNLYSGIMGRALWP
jgi:hypothetical protein